MSKSTEATVFCNRSESPWFCGLVRIRFGVAEFALVAENQFGVAVAREIGEGGGLIADPLEGQVFLPVCIASGSRILKPVGGLPRNRNS